jgi:hypothetical protein
MFDFLDKDMKLAIFLKKTSKNQFVYLEKSKQTKNTLSPKINGNYLSTDGHTYNPSYLGAEIGRIKI